jgi:hypothetical protein
MQTSQLISYHAGKGSRATKTVLSALVALLLLAGIACADTIYVSGVDGSRGESIWIREDSLNNQTYQDTQAYFAGVILVSVSTQGHIYQRDSLCVDLFTNINVGGTYDTYLRHPNQVPGKNLPRASWLVDNALLPTQDPSAVSELPDSDLVKTAAQGAGIQLAIWDIVHDGGDGFASGRVQAAINTDPTVLGWAEAYEALSTGRSSSLAFVYDNFVQGSKPALEVQMLIGPRFEDGGPTPNPEPSTFALVIGPVLIVACKWFRSRLRK